MPVSPKYYFYYMKDDCRKGQERLWARDLTESFFAYSQKIDSPSEKLHYTFDSPKEIALLGVWALSWSQSDKTPKIW